MTDVGGAAAAVGFQRLDAALYRLWHLVPQPVRERFSNRTFDTGDHLGSRAEYIDALIGAWTEYAAQVPITPPQAGFMPVTVSEIVQTTVPVRVPVPDAEQRRALAYVNGLYHEEVEVRRAAETRLTEVDAERAQWRQRAVDAEAVVANYRRDLVTMTTQLREFGQTAGAVIADPARLAAFLERTAALTRTIDAAVAAPNPRPPGIPAPGMPTPGAAQGLGVQAARFDINYGQYQNRPDAPARAAAQIAALGLARGRQPRPARDARPDGRDPNVVARELLVDCLTPAQRVQFERDGTFNVQVSEGQYAGRNFEVTQQHSMGVYALNPRGTRTGVTFCIVPDGSDAEYPPVYDHMLAEKLLLESDPATFFRIAIRHGRND